MKSLFKGVRVSKYRHVYGSVARKDQCYDNINITKNAHDSNFCAANPKFLAIVTESCGGGSMIIIPIDKAGRVDNHAGRVTGHRGQIFDIKWNPFNDNVIASCSDDTTIKLWYIPDSGLLTRNMTQPIVELTGHKRRVNFIEWHPVADNILVSAGSDHLIMVWNTLTAESVRQIDCHHDTIHSMSFNRDGSLLATTCKDKKLRIIDPRSGRVVNEGLCHHGIKASKVVYLGDTHRLFTVGFSRYSDRQWAIWSEKDLSAPLTIENIDSSSGVLFPYYDHDTRMIYIAGKGDGNIRYYETTDEHPYCHYLSQFLSGFPQRSLGMMPKRGCDVYRCEVAKFYKLHATKSICEPISMIVPRKSEQFQSDVFPDTVAPQPALTADQWLSGQNRNPILFNLKTAVCVKTNKPIFLNQTICSSQPIVTKSINSERKLEFISQANPVDYREKENLITAQNDDQNSDLPANIVDGQNENAQLIKTKPIVPSKFKQSESLNIPSNRKPFNDSTHNEAKKKQFPPPIPQSLNNRFSQINNTSKVSYRNLKSKPNADDDNYGYDGISENENSLARQRLPWIRDRSSTKRISTEKKDLDESKQICDIVSIKHLPKASYIVVNDKSNDSSSGSGPDEDENNTPSSTDSDDSANNTTDDSIADELAFTDPINIQEESNSNNNNLILKLKTNNSKESFNGNLTTSNETTSVSSTNESPQLCNENMKKFNDCNDNDGEGDGDLIDSNLPTPKTERELWIAFNDQRALIHKLRTQIKIKEKRINDLERQLSQKQKFF
ncbi:programmed cell death 6-interacting protein [Sarcoptes scabiei]|nr:programmed cell death 6-interacting protein [Sarcoptes scabiei]